MTMGNHFYTFSHNPRHTKLCRQIEKDRYNICNLVQRRIANLCLFRHLADLFPRRVFETDNLQIVDPIFIVSSHQSHILALYV